MSIIAAGNKPVTIVICGSGGSGVASLGELLLKLIARRGYYGILKKSFGPQIRGGESAVALRLDTKPVHAFDDRINLLIVLNWSNYARFKHEFPLPPKTSDSSTSMLTIQDSQAGAPEDELKPMADALSVASLPFMEKAQEVPQGRANILLLGFLARCLNISLKQAQNLVTQRFRNADNETQLGLATSAEIGYALAEQWPDKDLLTIPQAQDRHTDSWLATGNQLAALGALEAGVRFAAAYPITPASDALEWLAQELPKIGGHLVQAEDELAAINMVLGAGFGGVPAMTATSGPGLALMTETMGLAVASETPAVVLNVMRGGPSTGIPTKSEQADLNLALFGLHGDAPHIVLAALSIPDCHTTSAWAVQLASQYQTLAIVLSDQFLGHSMQVMQSLGKINEQARLAKPPRTSGQETAEDTAYLRYLDTATGISPMAVPGDPACIYTADGLEHKESGTPSPEADVHARQLEKRQRKLEPIRKSALWAEVSQFPDTPATDAHQPRAAIICWGSVSGAAREAAQKIAESGDPVRVIAMRLLAPFPKRHLEESLRGIDSILVVEQNHEGQFSRYLASQFPALPFATYCQPGPQILTASIIARKFNARFTQRSRQNQEDRG